MNAAFHLLGAQPGIDRAADVVGHHDPLHLALVVEDHHLRRVAERQMRRGIQDRLGRSGARREVADVLASILPSDQLLELPHSHRRVRCSSDRLTRQRERVQLRGQLARRVLRRRAAQRRPA